MTPDSKTAAAKTRPALAAVATLCALVLVACNAQAEAPAPENSASTATGVLETSAGIYEFAPVSCGIHEKDGVYDILIAGSGKAPDGEAFYFDLSPTEMSIDLGVDVPFKTSDRQIRAGHYVSQPFALDVSDRIVSVSSLALVDERGQSIDANARMRIDCGA